ncbi:transporter substrate-binding domain-containing protein [Acuticoccus sp. I52.16.1]|uniref:transporter substrate-binding domain-containing protein n=1 Tax=Acuticoccus sp. I52.16.1 TaxID=2928472 RepID=UPI001FD4FA75|nr:transporter substrate-binding domain-containing protein [Acuticoccus sp. I52.16.1]UOM34706.1 transporter substrate-binding domain-containing protein [Acuticoccus sp. I52.16.1]
MTPALKATLIAAGLAVPLIAAPLAASAQSLKTGVDGTFAPHAFPTLDGKTEGFNMDLGAALGEALGTEVEIDVTQWSGLLPGMQAGTYDFVLAPTTVTEERAGNMIFTEPYLNTDFQFVTKKGAPEITDLKEFDGKVIAVNKGSAYDQWARDIAGDIGWTVESYGTNLDALQAVMSGRAFANVAGNTNSAWAVKTNPQLQLSYLYSTGKVFSIPLRTDNTELRAKLDMALECLKESGKLAELHEKWFGYAPAADSATATIYPGVGIPDMPGYDATEHELSCS